MTFKNFDRTGSFWKFWKSVLWIFWAPLLVIGRKYDVIYCDDSYPFYPIFVKLACPKSKVVIRIGDFHLMYHYSGWVYDFLHFFEKVGWMMADVIIVISNEMAEHIASETLRYCEVVPDPVDPKDFKTENSFGDGSVMFHGLLTRNKNVDILLEAAALMPQTDFLVVGVGPDLNRLMSIAPPNVHFQGWVPFKDIKNNIAQCSVGVALRSDNPGNEFVVTSPFLQYGVMGKPCLVTRRRVFGDYPWQFSGVHEMVKKLRVLLARPHEEGQKLREFVLKNHSAEKIAEDIWRILM